MSWAASAWAKQAGRQAGKALNPALRYLLVCVADRTNDDTGYTFASPRCLADDVGNSVDSIKAGLRQLEAMGYLARVRRLKADGSHDTSLIVLLRDDDCAAIAARLGWTRPAADTPEDAADEPAGSGADPQDVEGWGENHPYPQTDGVGGNPPGGWGENHPYPIDEPEKITSNPQPPSRVRPLAAPSADRGLGVVPAVSPARTLPDGYDPDVAGANAFLADWQGRVNHTTADVPERIRKIWRGLSPGERRRAAGDLERWHQQLRREKRPFGSATRYLRDKGWQVLDGLKDARRAGTAAAVFFIREGSPEWQAWERHEARHGRVLRAIPSQHEKGRGWWMASLWPPREAGAAGVAAGAAATGEAEAGEVARLLAGG